LSGRPVVEIGPSARIDGLVELDIETLFDTLMRSHWDQMRILVGTQDQ
jgi:hypothetical protein